MVTIVIVNYVSYMIMDHMCKFKNIYYNNNHVLQWNLSHIHIIKIHIGNIIGIATSCIYQLITVENFASMMRLVSKVCSRYVKTVRTII